LQPIQLFMWWTSSSSLLAAKNFLSVDGRVGTFFQWFFFSSYSPTLQQLMGTHSTH
jgi:hypothetical protein